MVPCLSSLVFDIYLFEKHHPDTCSYKPNINHRCLDPSLIIFQIYNKPVDYQYVDKGRVNSFENADHVPQGGDVEVPIL